MATTMLVDIRIKVIIIIFTNHMTPYADPNTQTYDYNLGGNGISSSYYGNAFCGSYLPHTGYGFGQGYLNGYGSGFGGGYGENFDGGFGGGYGYGGATY